MKLVVQRTMGTSSCALLKQSNHDNHNRFNIVELQSSQTTMQTIAIFFRQKNMCTNEHHTLIASTAATAPCFGLMVPPPVVVSKRSSRLYAVRQRSLWPRDCRGGSAYRSCLLWPSSGGANKMAAECVRNRCASTTCLSRAHDMQNSGMHRYVMHFFRR